MAQLRSDRVEEGSAAIAFVTSRPISEEIATLRGYYQGAAERARLLGYSPVEFCLNAEGMTDQRLDRILRARAISGVLLMPRSENDKASLELDWDRYALSTIGFSREQPKVHRASVNHYADMELVMRKLRDQIEVRRVGLALPRSLSERIRHIWLAAFLACQATDPCLTPDVPICLFPDGSAKEIKAWLLTHQPDILITCHNEARRALAELETKIPLVHLDCGTQKDSPPGIRQNWEMVGAAAIDQIVGQIHRNERGLPSHPQTTSIASDWIEGSSDRREALSS